MDMHDLITELLSKNLIEKITEEIATDNLLNWFKPNHKQWIITRHGRQLLINLNNGGYYDDIFAIEFIKNEWYIYQFHFINYPVKIESTVKNFTFWFKDYHNFKLNVDK